MLLESLFKGQLSESQKGLESSTNGFINQVKENIKSLLILKTFMIPLALLAQVNLAQADMSFKIENKTVYLDIDGEPSMVIKGGGDLNGDGILDIGIIDIRTKILYLILEGDNNNDKTSQLRQRVTDAASLEMHKYSGVQIIDSEGKKKRNIFTNPDLTRDLMFYWQQDPNFDGIKDLTIDFFDGKKFTVIHEGSDLYVTPEHHNYIDETKTEHEKK